MNPQTQYVVDIMTQDPVVVGPDAATWSADHLAEDRGVHHLLVVDGYRLIGVVCNCDLRDADGSANVGARMHTHPETIDDQATASAALTRMTQAGVGCLPVVDWSGALRGVVTRHDLRKAGFPPPEKTSTCASCGSTHGLGFSEVVPESEEAVVFCIRCKEQARQALSSIDEMYLSAGGSG